jgi:tryptophan-rich sensory protein
LIQLGLNAIWSPVFFGLQQPLLALMIIAGLWLILLIVISEAWNQKRIVFWLLLPYFIWISFASYLNAGILLLN